MTVQGREVKTPKSVSTSEVDKQRERFLEIATGKLGYTEEVAKEAAERATAAYRDNTTHTNSW